MTFEFQTPYRKVPEKLISEIRNEILKLSRLYKNISRAEVLMRHDKNIVPKENAICEIALTVFGDNIIAHARTENFENSALEAIDELKAMVDKQVQTLKDPPNEIVSKVKV